MNIIKAFKALTAEQWALMFVHAMLLSATLTAFGMVLLIIKFTFGG